MLNLNSEVLVDGFVLHVLQCDTIDLSSSGLSF